ncbi:hypothetical protein [Robbsia sp. KACC 23696]|uniref:hypothetical protein n=1 Tax=Robbsia sp. KACC 23696 TaxID=3149231 RepID=UPI00325BA165
MSNKTKLVPYLFFALISAACGLTSTAHAASLPVLTPQECHEYPFVHTSHIDHKDEITEMGELEAAGYNPAGQDPLYPADYDRAEHRLHVAYKADCLPPQAASARTHHAL